MTKEKSISLDPSNFFNNEAMEALLGKLGQFEVSLLQLTDTTSKMSQRISRVEKAIHIPAMPNNGVGEVVSINVRTLQKFAQTVALKTDIEESRRSIQDLCHSIEDLKTYLLRQQHDTRQDMDTKLHDALSTIKEHVVSIKDDFEYRIDRAEDVLRTQSKFAKQSAPAIKHLQSVIDDLIQSSSNATRKEDDLQNQLNDINEKQMNDHRQDIRIVQERIRALSQAMEGMAEQDTLLAFEHKFNEVQGTMESLESSISRHNKRIESMNSNMCLKQTLESYTSQSEFRTILDDIRNEMSSKLSQPVFQELQQTVDNLTEDYLHTKQKACLASDFVEWFSNKGEAYEQNLAVVDRHLKDLAIHNTDISTATKVDVRPSPVSILRYNR